MRNERNVNKQPNRPSSGNKLKAIDFESCLLAEVSCCVASCGSKIRLEGLLKVKDCRPAQGHYKLMQYSTKKKKKLGHKPINKPWFARRTQVYWYLPLRYKEKEKLLFVPAPCRFPRGFLMIIFSMRFGLRRQSKNIFYFNKNEILPFLSVLQVCTVVWFFFEWFR